MRWSRMVFEGVTPMPAAYSVRAGPASDRPPQPFGDLRDHVAEQQQSSRPYQRRDEIGALKAPIRHLEYPGRERHRSPQRSEKPPDENARHAPGFDEGLAARQDFGIARQWPHLRDV